MEIDVHGKDSVKRRIIRAAISNKWIVLTLIFVVGASFFLGAVAYKEGVHKWVFDVMTDSRIAVIHKLQSLRARPIQLIIDIAHSDFLMLQNSRNEALEKGFIVDDNRVFVNAQIRFDGRTYSADLRLKGDFTGHIDTDKWSFRIRVDGNDALLGMKQFSLMHPKERDYLNEWLFQQMMGMEGLISLRYDFVVVTVNGEELGVYALEEHFDTQLIENNRRREGVIVRFNEDLYWQEFFRANVPRTDEAYLKSADALLSSDIDAFHSVRTTRDSALKDQYLRAAALLDGFRNGELSTRQVFEVEKTAAFFALTDLLGAKHALRWHNMRYYYNPVTSLLEPISYDADAGHYGVIDSIAATQEGVYLGDKVLRIHDNKYRSYFFADELFYHAYMNKLEEISQTEYLDNVFVLLEPGIEQKLRILYRDFPKYTFERSDFYRNQSFIRHLLKPVKGVHAFLEQVTNDSVVLQVGNIKKLPIKIEGVRIGEVIVREITGHTQLESRKDLSPVRYSTITVPTRKFVAELNSEEIFLEYSVLGVNTKLEAEVFPWPRVHMNESEVLFRDSTSSIPSVAFLATDPAEGIIQILPGAWELTEPLIIPAGFKVICGDETTISLKSNAFILSYSPLEFIGSAASPIRIDSGESGQGIVVLSAEGASQIEFVDFANLRAPKTQRWSLTGGLTFYETTVLISDTFFNGSSAEDVLNIIRCDFVLERVTFLDALSDAVDIDFSQGRITQLTVKQAINDGIDLSGSSVEILSVDIDYAGDKAISVGEHAFVTVSDAIIKNSNIGIASKDLSEVTIKDVEIENTRIAITAYQKKGEYGPAEINAQSVIMRNNGTDYFIEEDSILTVDARRIVGSEKKVYEYLYNEAGVGP
jgi:hypothetical protein